MGQHGSKERDLFAQMLKAMLKAHGYSVLSGQEMEFLSFAHETCPWFPEEGTVNPATWERVGQQLRDRSRLKAALSFPSPPLCFGT